MIFILFLVCTIDLSRENEDRKHWCSLKTILHSNFENSFLLKIVYQKEQHLGGLTNFYI